jgi:hypothetical protein
MLLYYFVGQDKCMSFSSLALYMYTAIVENNAVYQRHETPVEKPRNNELIIQICSAVQSAKYTSFTLCKFIILYEESGLQYVRDKNVSNYVTSFQAPPVTDEFLRPNSIYSDGLRIVAQGVYRALMASVSSLWLKLDDGCYQPCSILCIKHESKIYTL